MASTGNMNRLLRSIATLPADLRNFIAPERRVKSVSSNEVSADPEDGGVLVLQDDVAFSAAAPSSITHIQLLNLSPIEKRAGRSWSRIESHVHRVVENTLTRRLRSGDTYMRVGSTAYALFHVDVSTEEAALRTVVIAREILKLLFADDFSDSDTEIMLPDIEVKILDVDAENPTFLKDMGAAIGTAAARAAVKMSAQNPSQKEMQRLVDASGIALQRMVEDVVLKPDPREIMRVQSFIEHLRDMERDLQHPAAAGAKGKIALEPVKGRTRLSYEGYVSRDVSDYSGVRERIRELAARAQDGLREAARKNVSPVSGGHMENGADLVWRMAPSRDFQYSIDYLPVVDVRTAVMGVHRARITCRAQASEVSDAERRCIENAPSVLQAADLVLLQSSVMAMSQSRNVNRVVAVGIDEVSLATAGARTRFLREGAFRIPLEIRSSIAFEIVLSRLHRVTEISRWVEDLAPFCRAIFLRLRRPSDMHIFEVETMPAEMRARLTAIGLEAEEGIDEKTFYDDMVRLVEISEALNLRAYVANAHNHSTFIGAIAAGVGYVFGEAVFEPRFDPASPVRSSLTSLIAGPLKP